MVINLAQRIVLTLGSVGLALSMLFPPWAHLRYHRFKGYYFIADPPLNEYGSVELTIFNELLTIQLAVIVLITIAMFLVAKENR